MTHTTTDYLIVGAGPAGLQLAYYLERDGHDYTVLEQGDAPGTFFTTFPRHRQMISNNKRYTGSDDPEFNLRMDWNSLLSDDPKLLFTRYSEQYFPPADDFVRYLADFAAGHGLRITFGRRAERVSRCAEGFTVLDDHGDTYRARRLVMATGVSRANVPDIPGADLAEHYSTVSVDPEEFTGQRVLIIGKGNSAFETADNLVANAAVIHVAGPRPVSLAWHTHFVGHLRAVNNNFLDTYQLKAQNAVLDVPVKRIAAAEGGGCWVTFGFTRGEVTIPYDRVIACTGFRFDASVFDEGCRPRLAVNDRFPELTDRYESVNVEGLFFAGTLTQQLDYRKSTNGFIHGFRYGARALYRTLNERYHGVPWPARDVAPDTRGLAAAVLARVNRSSALWQQYGTLADFLVVPPTGQARYYEELPARPDRATVAGPADDVFLVTLEYGPAHEAQVPFAGEVVHASSGTASSYLHPVVRHCRAGAVLAEHHIASDLENAWQDEAAHIRPLEAFLDDALARSGAGAAVG
ncbi:NAD(P)-binding domain-containing protein [Streptomyces sclerotialus]|uniref:NAD(P)-binding domain-containing protein n=1 Tax=Streptomyces sclerotialus TaxID=1957 RepID=UPI0004C4B406